MNPSADEETLSATEVPEINQVTVATVTTTSTTNTQTVAGVGACYILLFTGYAPQHCPPPLPLRPTRLAITPAEVTSAQTISTTGAAVVVKDKVELLTTPKQIKRYEKYLVKQKEKL